MAQSYQLDSFLLRLDTLSGTYLEIRKQITVANFSILERQSTLWKKRN